jgi:SAM-dependent methyltransferase
MSIPGLSDWLKTPQGEYVIRWELARTDGVVSDIFGFNALQLGLPEIDFLRANRITLRQRIGDEGSVALRCDLHHLPFASASIDLVVLPHILEFHADPHQILREVERILIPDGQLVITGFNPISLWGLRQRMSRARDGFPSNGHYLSVLRLKDWLQLLSFEVERGNFGRYAPPCQTRRWLRRWRFMEAAGDRWWSFAGGIYLLRAVKRVRGMRLIMPPWNQKKVPQKALTTVTQKEIKQHES